MSISLTDARVLVAVPDADDPFDVGKATGLADELGVEVVLKRGMMAFEYLRELAPTVDCVVCVGDRTERVREFSEVAPSVPLVVYADGTPRKTGAELIVSDGGAGGLADRVADEIRRGRERDRLDEANTKLNALNKYSRRITACETVEELTERVVAGVTDALAYESCVLGLREGDEIVPHGNTLSEVDAVNLGTDEGIAGLTFETGETHIVDDYHSHPRRCRGYDVVQSVLSVPVGEHGVLQVTADETGAFDERDAEFLEIVASHAREALSRLRRETGLRVERDRLHAFFEGFPAPTVYVEAEAGEPPVLREVNAAYETVFSRERIGDPIESAFPTRAERRLFGESIRTDERVTETIRRNTAEAAEQSLKVTLIPVRTVGLEAAVYGVYVGDERLS